MAVSDLTGTTWLFKEPTDWTNNTYSYSINFTSNNQNFTTMWADDDGGFAYGELNYNNTQVTQWPSFVNQAYRTISITGGTDVTNSSLISWLETNATQQSNADIIVEYNGDVIGEYTAPKEFTISTGDTVTQGDIVITTNGNVSRVIMMYNGEQVLDDSHDNSTYTFSCTNKFIPSDIVVDIYDKSSTFGFYISDAQGEFSYYECEWDMTWEDWVNSVYNTGNFFISAQSQLGFVQTTTTFVLSDSIATTYVTKDEAIIPNYYYPVLVV